MKKPGYALLIIITLMISCTQRLSTTNQQNSKRITLQFDGVASGCGNFFVYKDTRDKTKVLTIKGGTKELYITQTAKTFDIENNSSLTVQLDDYGQAIHGEYCSDVIVPGPRPQLITAISGKVTIHISKKNIKEGPFAAYKMTVTLEHVTFPDTNGKTFTIEKAEIVDVLVGWICC